MSQIEMRKLVVGRYKPYSGRYELELKPLTIVVGSNNSGKSALARAMPLLAGGLLVNRRDAPPLPLTSFDLVHGGTFEDIISGRSYHGHVTLGASFDHNGDDATLEVVVQNVATPGSPSVQVIQNWALSTSSGKRLELVRKRLDRSDYRLKTEEDGMSRDVARLSWLGLIPALGEIDAPRWAERLIYDLAEWARGVRYLRSPRELIGSPFFVPGEEPSSMGATGREAPLLLARSDDLLRGVQEWFMKAFGIRLEVRQQGKSAMLEVHRRDDSSTSISLDQAGQGLSQVLAVAVQCMTASGRGNGVDVVEHPEAELHPRVHAEVADLILEHLPGPPRPVIVETHSEVLLLRVRRRIAEGMPPDRVAIYWVDIGENNETVLERIGLTPEGELESWPDGVFLEDYDEIVAMRRAARQRSGS